MTSAHPYTDQALQFCEDVQSGKIPACLQIKQATKRHLDDLDRIDSDPNYPYTYDINKAEKVVRFATKLPHVSGRWAVKKDNHFKPEPWQSFFLTALFGWVHKTTGYRRFTEALLSVSRKNGKSFLSSMLAIYMTVADNEPGAQCFAASNSLEQPLTVFRPARQMVDRSEDLKTTFEIESNVKSLVTPDGSRFSPIIGVARDGQSCHFAVLDEYHESKDDSLYLSLSQSMGSRSQPLMLISTTAGHSIGGPCYEFQKDCERVLDGSLDRPELFALIFTINKDTIWTTDEALYLSNPNLGVSVNLEALRTEHRNAIKSAAKQNAFKTKKLNMWVGASTSWLNMAKWSQCADRKLKEEDFIGEKCWMSADLSTKLDVTAVMKLFKVGNKFYCFPRFYLPSDKADDPANTMYSKWVSEDYITSTEGSQIDMELVLNETVADMEKYKPESFMFDKWKAEFYTEMIGKRCTSVPLVEVPMEVKYISDAMKEVEAMVTAQTLRHPGNPVLTWMASNVVCKLDARDNVYPRKARAENKIDGMVALILAVSRAMVQKEASSPMLFFA